MVKVFTYKIIALWLVLLMSAQMMVAQQGEAFARIAVSPREGVVRQPYKVNISVYSSTWFSKGLQFSDFRIEDAFVIPFTRTVSSISYINGKKYATLTFYYLVFPYSTGTLTIPEISIEASIPPEGEYKGVLRTIKTRPQTITVNDIAKSQDDNVWMVAKGASIKSTWDRSTEGLKVGDVLERKITVRANGTLPSFISPLDIAEPDGVSLYPSDPVLQDKRNSEDVNGVRVEKYSYLLEREGEVLIPAIEVLWWNPYTKRSYKRVVAEQTLTVAHNPDLDLMISLKDSLEALSAPVENTVEQSRLAWKKPLAIVLLVVLLLYAFVLGIINLLKRRRQYLLSERYYFKRLLMSLRRGNHELAIRRLYQWYDLAKKQSDAFSISSTLPNDDRTILELFMAESFDTTSTSSMDKRRLIKVLKNLRKNLTASEDTLDRNSLNP